MPGYLTEHMGVILISGVLFFVGIMLGLVCKEDARGIVFSVSYPGNGGNMFDLGSTTTKISDIDLATISDADTHILIENIRTLSVHSHISDQLREMVRYSEAPFAKIPVSINLHFTDDSKISGPVAKACSNTPIYNKPVVAYDLKADANVTYKINGIMSLHAFWEHQQLSDCVSINSAPYDIWVSKEYVESWMGPIDPLRTNIIVKANIVASGI